MKSVKIYSDKNFEVVYDVEKHVYRLSTFEHGHFKHECSFNAYHENQIDRTNLANAVEEKMMYMCGCKNCIKTVSDIIRNDMKPFDSYCEDCSIDCHKRNKF